MIKARIVDRSDFWNRKKGFSAAEYSENSFFRLLNGDALAEEKFPPFRDEESLRIIEEVDHATLVEEEWYAMVTPFGKTCLSALSGGSKYALTVIYNSRNGVYTEYFHAGENVWKILGELPMDILIAVPQSEVLYLDTRPIYQDYILENYIYEGKEMPAYVHNTIGLEPYIEDGCIHTSMWDWSMQYSWKKDIPNVLAFIERQGTPRERLVEDTKEYGVNEWLERIGRLPEFEEDEDGLYDETEYNIEKRLDAEEIRIVNHMSHVPEMDIARRQPYMIVKRCLDDSYKLLGGMTIKLPEYEEVLEDVIPYAKEDGESFILLVGMDEVILEVNALKYAYLGFRTTKGKIELFDQNDALWEFGKLLKEAYESGNYIIDDGVC